MIERVFLGLQRPFLEVAVEWMAGWGNDWSGVLVVVPTAQSGRRLREALAEACGGAMLSPKFATPGAILRGEDAPGIAQNWEEELAWVAELEAVGNWEPFAALMPEPDRADDGWAAGLARELGALRRELQENGHTLASAAQRLAESVEADRWQVLATLERGMRRRLDGWGLRDRSRPFHEILPSVAAARRIVLAGVPDLPPVVAAALEKDGRPVTALVAADVADAAAFSACGTPLECWAERELPWPDGRVFVASDARHQAAMAVAEIAATGVASDRVAIGCADPEAGEELARALGEAGWPAFHPAGPAPPDPLPTWWRVFAQWLQSADFTTFAELLAFPQTGKLVGGMRFQKSGALHRMMDQAMVRDAADLRHQLDHNPDFARHPDEEKASKLRTQAISLLNAAEAMESWSQRMRAGEFSGAARALLDIIADPAESITQAMHEWLGRAEPMTRQLDKPARFWIDLMLGAMPAAAATPPDPRVIDIQGWLEVFHEPGDHLVLCGLNEGRVPAKATGESWLGEPARALLGLITADDRAARDAWLFQAVVTPRLSGNEAAVSLFCGKSSNGGDALLPSRLLLTGTGEALARRVRHLFRAVEPPDAGLRPMPDDWKWRPSVVEPTRLPSATALGDYLACPFRFYLKHILRMRRPEPERGEWNARDFGNLIHQTLENWGGNPALHNAPAREIAAQLIDEAERLIDLRFHGRPPLAVQLQRDAMRQRLRWTADVLAETHAEGWDIIATEEKIDIPVAGGRTISGMIDRIDRHRGTGAVRIVDYKTGNLTDRKSGQVEAAHRLKASATIHGKFAHLPDDSPAWHTTVDAKGRPLDLLWTNLQLPLYVAAIAAQYQTFPTPCYLTIGDTREKVALHAWEAFSHDDMESAQACADWIIGRIDARVFMPPAERPKYDDYAPLATSFGDLAGLVVMP